MKIAVLIIFALLQMCQSIKFDKKVEKIQKKLDSRTASASKGRQNNNFQKKSQNNKHKNGDIASLRQNFIDKTKSLRAKSKAGADGFKREDKDVLGVPIKDTKKLCRDAPGVAGKKQQKYKNLQANETRFSDGEAAYFYDVLSPLFEKKYAEEAAKNFKAFQTLNVYATEAKNNNDTKTGTNETKTGTDGTTFRFLQLSQTDGTGGTGTGGTGTDGTGTGTGGTGTGTDGTGTDGTGTGTTNKDGTTTPAVVVEGPFINLGGLKKGMDEFKWAITDLTAEDYMAIYTTGFNREKLYLREFMFMENEFVSKRVSEESCTNCLEGIRADIKKLFDHSDCSQSGTVTAEQLYNALADFKEDKSTIKATPSMVNAFVLKVMEINTATVNLKEFTYGILCGYMERIFEPAGTVKIVQEETMMDYRKKRVDLGNGPQ